MIRQNNISKREWVLDGDTVIYSEYHMIRQTLDYDFSHEQDTDYPSMSANEAIKIRYLADSPFCGREYKNDRSLRYEVSSDIWLQTGYRPFMVLP